MDNLYGQHEHSLDAKGRVILPAKFRPHFAEGGFLTKYNGGCLALWAPAMFGTRMGGLAEEQHEGAAQRNLARVFSAGTERVEVDRQGRLPIAPYLRSFAQLEADVLVNGAIDRVELWNPGVWHIRTAAAEERLVNEED